MNLGAASGNVRDPLCGLLLGNDIFTGSLATVKCESNATLTVRHAYAQSQVMGSRRSPGSAQTAANTIGVSVTSYRVPNLTDFHVDCTFFNAPGKVCVLAHASTD